MGSAKVGVGKLLVKTVQFMYSDARSRVQVGDEYIDQFDVNVSAHPVFVLSPLLFMTSFVKGHHYKLPMGSPEF